MKNKYFIVMLIFLLLFYFFGYYIGVKDSFTINCFSKGLVPMITPDEYTVCWNNTLKFDDTRFKLDLELGGYEYVE